MFEKYLEDTIGNSRYSLSCRARHAVSDIQAQHNINNPFDLGRFLEGGGRKTLSKMRGVGKKTVVEIDKAMSETTLHEISDMLSKSYKKKHSEDFCISNTYPAIGVAKRTFCVYKEGGYGKRIGRYDCFLLSMGYVQEIELPLRISVFEPQEIVDILLNGGDDHVSA